MTDREEKTIREIEQNWSVLRENIEQAKVLAEKSERLLKKHREQVKRGR